jgi:hypothetical protein
MSTAWVGISTAIALGRQGVELAGAAIIAITITVFHAVNFKWHCHLLRGRPAAVAPVEMWASHSSSRGIRKTLHLGRAQICEACHIPHDLIVNLSINMG